MLFLTDGSVVRAAHGFDGSATVESDRGSPIETFRDGSTFWQAYVDKRRASFSGVPFGRQRPFSTPFRK